MQPFGFCSGTYESHSPNVDAERCINWIPERNESAYAKSRVSLNPRPGLKPFCFLPEDKVPGLFTQNGRVFAIGNSFYELFAGGTKSQIGSLAASSTPPTIAGSQNQVLICKGGSLWVFDLALNILTAVNMAQFAGPVASIGYLDGFFVALLQDSQTLHTSDLLDGLTWNGLNKGDVSLFPDNLVSMIIGQREILVCGSKNSTIYYDSGTAFFPLAPRQDVFLEVGSAIQFGIAKLDNSAFWWGTNSDRGGITAYRLEGYTPRRVSTHAIESMVKKFSTTSDAVSYSLEDEGHALWVTGFPTADRTLVYDVSTGLWHEWGYWQNGAYKAHRSCSHTYGFGKHLVGDSLSGTVYEMSTDYSDDAGNPIRCMRRSPHVSDGLKFIYHDELRLDVETGKKPSQPLKGQAPPTLILTDADGSTWSVMVNDADGTLRITSVPGMVARTLILNDNETQQSWQITIGTNPAGDKILRTIEVTYQASYPQRFLLATPGGNQAGLFVGSGILETEDPESPIREPKLSLAWSDDGGHAWSNYHDRSLGKQGEYKKQVYWPKLGRARTRTYEVVSSDPVPVSIVEAFLKTS